MVTAVAQEDLEINRSGTNVFEITDLNGTNLAGKTVKFMAKWHPQDANSAAVISLGTTPLTGVGISSSTITLTIAPSDVLTTLPYETCVVKYELLVDGSLELRGNLIIKPNIIR
jgi:hypothetical protein